jgi:putative ABC transport system permease protein
VRPETRFHPAALLAALRGRWRALFDRDSVERELDEEMSFHLELEIEQNLAAGMSADEARRRALLSFGGRDRIAEEQRDARGTRLLEDAVTDLRHAARSLSRTPGFVAVSVVTLATAIAIGTVLFTAVNGFFYRPLPLPGGADLLAVFTSDYNGRERLGASSYPDILDFADAAARIAEIAGETRVMFGIGVSEHAVMAQGAITSPGWLRMLRVRPALGALPGAAPPDFPAIVLSHELWRRTFGADSSLVGSSVMVNGRPFTVIAVAPPGFHGTSREQAENFWIDGAFAPLVMPRDNLTRSRTARRFHVLARLEDGTTPEALSARLDVVATRLSQAVPDAWRDATGRGRTVTAMRERDAHLAAIPRRDLLLVVGGVTALGLGLLVIASLNLASLQLARGAARRREIATRLALGAGRGRLVRQLLAECALVVLPGVAAGVAAALAVSALVSHFRPIPLPSIDLGLDWRALGFIAGALLLSLLVFGLMPALQTVRTDLLTDLKGGHQPGAGGIRVGGMRGGLIVAQVALSVAFTAASAMVALALVREAGRGREEARSVLVAQLNFLPAAGDSSEVRALTDRLLADIAALPGVEHAAAADFIPVRGARRTIEAELLDLGGASRRLVLDANAVGPDYFATLGLPVLRGRSFEPRDAAAAEPVVIVSRAMADALWPATDPVGRRITLEARRGTASAEVIGVVADPAGQGPATAESFPGLLYLPLRYIAEAELVLHVRSPGSPGAQRALAGEIMRRLRAEQAKLVTPEVITLENWYNRIALPQRVLAQASGALAAFQLLLAVAGLSGLVAYVTALRRREVGIRTALGASRGSVLALVMRQGIRLTALGALVGVTLSLPVSRGVALSLPVTLPIVLGAVLLAAVLAAVTAAIAMLLPARRALEVAPAAALRVD